MKLIAITFAIVLLLAVNVQPITADGPYVGCKPYPVGPNSPTGIVGCVVYGIGVASWYHGTGVARNDCTYPWTKCQAISIRSLDTGKIIYVTPNQFCDCYTGTPKQRIVDLSPDEVSALGLNPSRGLFKVEIQPVDQAIDLPNTAMEQP